MGSVTAKSIIDKAAILLLDVPQVRWTKPEMIGWINDGQNQIVVDEPTATIFNGPVKLTAGTKQKLPADGYILFEVFRNLTNNGTAPGAAIRIVSRELLDNFDPNWHTATASLTIQNYIFNAQDPTTFYVFPPSPGTNYVELSYSKRPAVVLTENDTLSIDDMYQTMLLNYIMFRACSKDAEYANGVAIAQMYYGLYKSGVDGKDAAELENNPNLDMTPMNPAAKGTAN